ncbi:tripartite tricarboxylate transporter substrate binding protein [Noviherbaspirillum saxi]|uniref:Bug family tripartite tricarboxylate transporter substrate binding protein n=1 Tax=Noviherbaspirillum saxi TaxID=2320863 RepID=UPI0026D42C66
MALTSTIAFAFRLASRMGLATLASVAIPGFAQTGSWPQKPVTVIVAFAPGGMTDTVTRILARELSQVFKQPFVVENKPGAAGQLATEYVARRPNDGYTLLVSATGHVIAPSTRKKVNYDPVKDFEPIAILAKSPNLLVVNPQVPAHNVPEFLKWAKAQPSVPYASAGAGGSTHLAGELLRHESGITLTHVPYKGAAPAVNDTVAGQVSVAFQDSMSVASFVAAGKLRPIAVTTAARSPLFPDLPTLMESGYKNFDVYTWLGLYAPAGTPAEIVSGLNKVVNKFMNSAEIKEKLKAQNSEPGGIFRSRRCASTSAEKSTSGTNS